MLLDERHPVLDGLARRGRRERFPAAEHLAGRRMVEPGEDAHQRRLAGPVLAEDRQHLAGADVEVDVTQRLHLTEAAGDTDHLQGGGASFTRAVLHSGMYGTSKDPSLISAVRVSSSSIASSLIRSASSGLMTTSRPSSATPTE